MSETVRAKVAIVEAGAPPRRAAVIQLGGGRIAHLHNAPPGGHGPTYDVVLPGLIDAHSHARGVPLAAHGIGAGPLERFLLEVRALTPLSPRDEAYAAADAALAAGITAVQVFCHDFGDAAAYAQRVGATAEGCAEAGIRAFIALGLTDQDEYAPATNGLRRKKDAFAPGRGVTPESFPQVVSGLLGEHGLVSIDGVGPVAPQWCSDDALRAIAMVPGARRVHAHLLESARQRLAPDAVARMERAGLLSPAGSFAHGIWLDDAQIGRVARAGATIVHCPGSNVRLGAGACPVRRLLSAGVSVALGLDSNGSVGEPDMFAEMRAALQTAMLAGSPLTATEVLAMATTGGAKALARPDLGTLRPGAAADVVALNLLGVAEAADPVGYVVEHATRESVAATWVAGRHTARSPAAAAARARLAAALEADAPARAARLAGMRGTWEAVDRAWRAAEQRAAIAAGSR
ncbi:MAG TPA: amidohydrolase family protein [Streptosporangiaceae bacterium]|nr:amidohydrolase family protein [Streptosporangiaceae bacterium]